MLEAIISFFPSEGAGAIGALDWTPVERKKLATESKSYCCALCGPVSELLSEPPQSDSDASVEDGPDATILSQISQLQMTQKTSDSSKSPAESSKIQSCCECKESSSITPVQAAAAMPAAGEQTEETAHTEPPTIGIADVTAAPAGRKSDLINDIIFLLLILVISFHSKVCVLLILLHHEGGRYGHRPGLSYLPESICELIGADCLEKHSSKALIHAGHTPDKYSFLLCNDDDQCTYF